VGEPVKARTPAIQQGLPRTVKVGAHLLRFAFASERRNRHLVGLNGLCDFDAGTIYINRDHAQQHSPDRVLATILHELTHAINHVYGVRDESDEEGFASGFSLGFTTFLVDNPAFLLWLSRVVADILSHHHAEIAKDEAPHHPRRAGKAGGQR
jgi:hypothetical protein